MAVAEDLPLAGQPRKPNARSLLKTACGRVQVTMSGSCAEAKPARDRFECRAAWRRSDDRIGSRTASGKEAIQYHRALVSAHYNVAEAARRLGPSRAPLAYRLKRHGLL